MYQAIFLLRAILALANFEEVFPGNFPDPSVIAAEDGRYYAFATQGAGSNIQTLQSFDLKHWKKLPDAMPTKPSWASDRQNFWAPDVSIHEGKYFLYFAAESNDQGYCVGAATSVAPAGPYEPEAEPILCAPGISVIDPMAFDDPATGNRYLYFGSGEQPLRAVKLTKDRLRQDHRSPEREVLNPSDAKYERLIEAPWLDYHDGFYYLYYSGDNCCHGEPQYAVRVARSRSPLGPFDKAKDALVESSDSFLAPGHSAMVRDKKGQAWIFFHGIKEKEAKPVGENGGVPARPLLRARLDYFRGWPRLH